MKRPSLARQHDSNFVAAILSTPLHVDDDSAHNLTLTVESFRTNVMVPFDKHSFSGVRPQLRRDIICCLDR